MQLYLKACSVKRVKKAISLFLSVVLTFNICAIISLKTYGSSQNEQKAAKEKIIERAVAYLENEENADHSIGDSRTINDTSDALSALRTLGEHQHNESVQWLTEQVSTENTDMTARLISATGNPEYLEYIKDMQNEDGSFGLYPGYAGDVMDSVLVLEAINDIGYTGTDISCTDLCSYLIASVNGDGGFSYNDANASDYILSSMAVYNIGRFFYTNNYDMSVLSNSLDYINENTGNSYSDENIEKTIYKFLALQACQVEFDAIEVVEELEKAEKADGSFAGSVHITSLAIKLLSSLDLENRVRITGFNTVLSNTEGTTNKSTSITAETNIGYISNYDAPLDLKFSVYNGENVVYENNSSVLLQENETSLVVNSGEFRLSEPSSAGVYALVELYNCDTLIKSQKIVINISDNETVYSTEISELAVELDSYSAYKDSAAEVGVSYALLYATNVKQDVKMKTIVTKDNKEINSVSEECDLTEEKNILSGTPLSFNPDTSKEGKYEITVICFYNDEEICRRTVEFVVQSAPVIKEKTDDIESEQFEVTWFGPILSDYYIFAGNETEISVGAEINYFSNCEFTGNIEIQVYKGEECIAENTTDISLEKGIPTYFEGKANYPVYKKNSQLSFSVKNVGEYNVYAKLYNSKGELLKEGECRLQVLDKPVQDLVLNSTVDEEASDMVNLSWNDISNDAESYSYQLYRRTPGANWEPRSIWNEEEKINVLNVYPKGPYLENWMNTTISDTEYPAGKGIFDIESVHFPVFSSDPYGCLLNDDGTWKYDVIFFGSSDCNDGYDLDETSSEVLQKFIDSGRGVLFGHDTLCGGSSYYLKHHYFNDFAEQAGLVIKTPSPEVWYRTTSVSVVKIGTLTNYPWVIRGNLTVPNTHSTGQYLYGATRWIDLNATKRVDEETGAIDNFYLCTNNNIGMIQTGDSTGQASDDERKILANTLFYLYQISQQTTAKDASFYDIDAPNKPTLVSSSVSEGKMTIDISSVDNKTEYEYYISANSENTKSENVLSNIRRHETLSGLAGFVVEVNNSSEPSSDLIKYDENNENILNLNLADSNGNAKVTVSPTDLSEPQYIHIFAVDNANNVSEELIVPFSDTELVTNIETDKKLYSCGDTVSIDTYTVSAPFGRTADMTIDIYDEFDNKTSEIASEPQQILTADERFISSAEWSVPDNLVGRYKAVITWENDNDIIAKAETELKIANEESVLNTVSSDKMSYSVSDPINLENIVYNKSQGMTENDLILNIKVYNTDTSCEAASFEHSIGLINPNSSADYSDSIAPNVLVSGNYRVISSIIQGNSEISTDTAEFTVTDDVTSFTGKLKFNSDVNSASVDFSVTNNGTENADEALITLSVYKEGATERIYTYSESVSIGIGETVSRSQKIDVPLTDGEYYGVLSVNYKGSSSDLDYDGFELMPLVTTVSNSVTDMETASTTSASKKPVTKTQNLDSPKTGVKDIPTYMWVITILSFVGLIAIKMTGGSEDEKD